MSNGNKDYKMIILFRHRLVKPEKWSLQRFPKNLLACLETVNIEFFSELYVCPRLDFLMQINILNVCTVKQSRDRAMINTVLHHWAFLLFIFKHFILSFILSQLFFSETESHSVTHLGYWCTSGVCHCTDSPFSYCHAKTNKKVWMYS